MKEVDIRVRIPEALHVRYRIICLRMRLSFAKQTEELIRKFVEIRESEDYLETECRKRNK